MGGQDGWKNLHDLRRVQAVGAVQQIDTRHERLSCALQEMLQRSHEGQICAPHETALDQGVSAVRRGVHVSADDGCGTYLLLTEMPRRTWHRTEAPPRDEPRAKALPLRKRGCCRSGHSGVPGLQERATFACCRATAQGAGTASDAGALRANAGRI